MERRLNQKRGSCFLWITTIIDPINDTIPTSLVDESAPPKEVNDEMGFSFIQGNDKIDEVENDEGD